MSLGAVDYLTLFVFVVAAIGLVNVFRIGLSQWLKWDIGEKERLLQQRLTEMSYECEKYKEEVSDLRRQIKLLLSQYDDAIVKLSEITTQYAKAQADSDKLRKELQQMKQEIREPGSKGSRILISALGSDDRSFALDSASLWAVNTETGLQFEEIKATTSKLMESLDRARAKQLIVYLHLAVKSDEKGYQLIDQIVDAGWLAPVLSGVIVLLVAGSDSSTVGDLLGVVPYVITMNDKVSSREAALFSRAFWIEIGRGLGPTQALHQAFNVAPARMQTMITQHWGS